MEGLPTGAWGVERCAFKHIELVELISGTSSLQVGHASTTLLGGPHGLDGRIHYTLLLKGEETFSVAQQLASQAVLRKAAIKLAAYRSSQLSVAAMWNRCFS